MAVRKIRNTWYVDIRHEGRRHRKRSPENSRAGAQAYEALYRGRLANGRPLEEDIKLKTDTFSNFSTKWFEVYVKANNKPSEQRAKESILRLYLQPTLGRLPLFQVSSGKIEKLKAKLQLRKLSAKRINNILAVLSKCLRTAVEWDYLESSPRIQLLKTQVPKIDYLTQTESNRLLEDTSEPCWNPLVVLALRTGMRVGELLALQWTDINFAQSMVTIQRDMCDGVITATKNYKIRHVPLTSDALKLLTSIPRRGVFIFPRSTDSTRPRSYVGAWEALQRICRSSSVRSIGWHILRHTFASHLVTNGVSIYQVMTLLGHSSIKMTMRYAHLNSAALREAISVLERPPTESNLGTMWATPIGVKENAPLERQKIVEG